MSSVSTHAELHDLFNRRDFEGLIKRFAADLTYTDRARNHTMRSPEEFRAWLEEWVSSLDGKVTEPRYLDAGDTSVALFVGTGVNKGPMGPFPATGRPASFPLCEVLTHGADGLVTGGEIYYDQMGLLIQLGHIEAPAG